MGKPLSNVVIEAPGFYGVNTEDSPASMPPAFAQTADNCVVDSNGRMASRKGLEYITTTGGTDSDITSIFEFLEHDGSVTVLSSGNNKVYSGTTTLTDETGVLTITADNWQIVQSNDTAHFFQSGHEPLVYDSGTLGLHSAHGAATGTPPQGDCVVSGFGRLFTAGVSGSDHIIYWSDLLLPTAWSGGTSGSLDTQKFWPNGHDSITALAVHNGFLVVFGTRNILVYAGAEDPSSMTLQDTIAGIGCEHRDSIVNTGSDLLFLDSSGYRSLGRTIQEKSSPIGNVSRNVNTELLGYLVAETSPIKGVYDRIHSNILLIFPDNQVVACFDAKMQLENGTFRATWWTSVALSCAYSAQDNTLYLGATDGIKEYSDEYTDEGGGYVMRYYSWPQDFGEPVVEKITKGLSITSEGGNALTIAIKYAFDYKPNYKTQSLTLPSYSDGEFGEAEFGVAEFGGGGSISHNHVNLTGRGRTVALGVEATIAGDGLAVQEMNIHSVLGRII